eukprot:scaffold14750_cov99-Isochrysis_galbana.AAC.1
MSRRKQALLTAAEALILGARQYEPEAEGKKKAGDALSPFTHSRKRRNPTPGGRRRASGPVGAQGVASS